ncbi:MAG: hypothetical protein EOP84_31485 [Verrucomicrobiaceae bacterium]|nr:MAG: hypothetical protein EOP84_31485 [Verrucomicrobiaceae bacterium]
MAKTINAPDLRKRSKGVVSILEDDNDANTTEAIRKEVLLRQYGVSSRSLVGLIGAHHYGEARDE